MPRIPALLMLQLTWDTLREVGFTTTCAPTLAAEGKPKSNAGVVVSSSCAEGVETGLDAALFVTSVFEPLLLFGSSGGCHGGFSGGRSCFRRGDDGGCGKCRSRYFLRRRAGRKGGAGLCVGVGVFSGIGLISTTGVGSGSFCRAALQDTASTMIPITSSRQTPPTISNFVRLSN